MLAPLFAAIVLAEAPDADVPATAVPDAAPLPRWDPGAGRRLGRAGAITVSAGAGLVGFGLSTREVCCFGREGDALLPSVIVVSGATGVIGGTPLVVAGPLVRAAELRRRGIPVSPVPGAVGAGLAVLAYGSLAWSAGYDAEEGAVAGFAGLGAAWIASGLQALLNDEAATRDRVFRYQVADSSGG